MARLGGEGGYGRDSLVAALLQNDWKKCKWFKSFVVKAEMLHFAQQDSPREDC